MTSKRKSVIAKDKAILKLLAEAMARGYPPGKFYWHIEWLFEIIRCMLIIRFCRLFIE